MLSVPTFLLVAALRVMWLSAIFESGARPRPIFATDSGARLLSHCRVSLSEVRAVNIRQFETWLRRCGEFFKAEEVLLLQVDAGRHEMSVVQSWARLTDTSTADKEYWRSPALLDRVWDGASAMLSDSVAVAAMGSGEQIFGGLAIRRAEPGHLTPDDTNRLRLIAEAFANVLARRRGDDERIRAELEAQRSRAELAHVSRQRSMGELTASLAHELNQPLTGILGNAQARDACCHAETRLEE